MVKTRIRLASRQPLSRGRRCSLAEDVVRGLAPLGSGERRVDRDKKLIRGIKILGFKSINGRRYTPEAIVEAYKQHLYEGIAVYVNHPDRPNDPRAIGEKLGRAINIQLIEGELYGDLEYLESHRDAALVCEMAERMDDQLGCSHNAIGEGEDDADGIFVVRHITEVRSVDLVTEPATTRGLFEQQGRKPVAIKIKQLFENSWKKYARRVTKRPRLAAYMKALVEEDEEEMMDEDVPGEEEVPADHETALRDGFEAAVGKIVADCLDGDEDPGECIKKIAQLLKAHHKLTGEPDREEGDLEEEEEEEPKKEEAEEQRKRITRLERENLIHREAGKLGVTPDEVLMEALQSAPSDKQVRRLLEREKERGGNANPPRSGAGGDDPTKKATLEGVDTNEGFLAALLG
jgi:hypothetical protein